MVNVALADSPVIRCDAATALLGDTDVVLACEIKARPEVTALFWVINIDAQTTIVANGDHLDNDIFTSNMVSIHCTNCCYNWYTA